MDRTSVCARPGCQAPAAAWLTYAYTTRQVWLDDPGPVSAVAAGDRWALCAAHASRLRAPAGWSQHDRRTGGPPVPPALVP